MAQPAKETGHVDAAWFESSAHSGLVDPVYDFIDQVKLGPSAKSVDHIGFAAYRTGGFFSAATPEMRNDIRSVKLCARYGLVEYWLETQNGLIVPIKSPMISAPSVRNIMIIPKTNSLHELSHRPGKPVQGTNPNHYSD